MKNFTRITTISLVIFLSVCSASAQTKWQKEKAQTETDNIQAALELNDTKSAELYTIQLASLVELKKITDSYKAKTITADERKAKAKIVRQDANKKMQAALGTELAKKYRLYRKEQREMKKNK